MDLARYWDLAWTWLETSGLRIALVLALAIVGIRIASVVAARLVRVLTAGRTDDVELEKRARTLGSVVRWVINVALLAVAAMMVLRELGIEIGPLLAAAGVVGLAVGFGAQNLVRDVIGGFFILLDDQIRVGDVVEIAGKSGLVERVTLRMTTLRDLAGNVHFVPNGQIDVVTNMTKDYSRYVFDIGVAYREDVDEVIALLREIDASMRSDPEWKDDILEPLEVLGLDAFGDSAVVVKARTKTRPIRQWAVGREFNRRLKKAFDERGIEIPFPHRTLYMGVDKKGDAPPLRVELRGAPPAPDAEGASGPQPRRPA